MTGSGRETAPLSAEELRDIRAIFDKHPEIEHAATPFWLDVERLLVTAEHALDAAREPAGRDALVSALAYALARAQLPGKMDTSRDYAERLAPLVIESGYLAAEYAAQQDREKR